MTKMQAIETLETDIKQYLLNQWGIKQQRKYSIFLNDNWHVALHNLPLLRLQLKLIPKLHAGYDDMWQKVRAFTIHSVFRSNICIKEKFDPEEDRGEASKLIYDTTTKIYSNECVFCHEFVHVCTHHLRLPHWLNEGIAMLTVEKYFNMQTINYSTLNLLKQNPEFMLSSEIGWLKESSPKTIACQYAAGYWLSRYLHKQHPDSFKHLLAKPHKEQEIKTHLTEVCGLDIHNLNNTVLSYFQAFDS